MPIPPDMAGEIHLLRNYSALAEMGSVRDAGKVRPNAASNIERITAGETQFAMVGWSSLPVFRQLLELLLVRGPVQDMAGLADDKGAAVLGPIRPRPRHGPGWPWRAVPGQRAPLETRRRQGWGRRRGQRRNARREKTCAVACASSGSSSCGSTRVRNARTTTGSSSASSRTTSRMVSSFSHRAARMPAPR